MRECKLSKSELSLIVNSVTRTVAKETVELKLFSTNPANCQNVMLESASWLGVAETTADYEHVNKGLIVHNTIPQIIQNIWQKVALVAFNSFLQVQIENLFEFQKKAYFVQKQSYVLQLTQNQSSSSLSCLSLWLYPCPFL